MKKTIANKRHAMPKYRELAHLIQERIANNELKPGNRLPSIAEVCREFKVTVTTANQVYNVLEQDGLIVRLQGKGTFVAEPQKTRLGTIGLVLIGIEYDDNYITGLIAGIQSVIREHDARLLLIDEFSINDLAKIDGLLLFCHSDDIPPMNLPALLPKVLLMFPAQGVEISNIVADEFQGAKLATEHLLSLGHRRISYLLSSDFDAYSGLRLEGYKAALKEYNIPFAPELIRYLRQRGIPYPQGYDVNYFQEGGNAMQAWIADGWRSLEATAILTPNDMSAISVMNVIKRNGIRIPQDVSVIGFDGLDVGEHVLPALTTIHVPLREIGVRGTQLLYEQIQKGEQIIENLTLPVQLKVRESAMTLF